MLRTCNNTDSNKLVIFSGIALYYGDNYIILLKLDAQKGDHVTLPEDHSKNEIAKTETIVASAFWPCFHE